MNWHTRYTQQARWTQSLRAYLYPRVNIQSARRILEVGCGTGALLTEIAQQTGAALFGVDIDRSALDQAAAHAPESFLSHADGLRLPFIFQTFDIVYCHFLLLWVRDPLAALIEMKRVIRPNGAILALAEPDYGGRIDYPAELAVTGEAQRESLRAQGADPDMGRKLKGLFAEAGITPIETGVLGGQWHDPLPPAEWENEWAVIESDLAGAASSLDLPHLKKLDRQAYARHARVLFVPTFYAWGRVV
jgi:SAM-dependent methyltransferase